MTAQAMEQLPESFEKSVNLRDMKARVIFSPSSGIGGRYLYKCKGWDAGAK
jgi:hypothetical protein